MTMMMPAHPEPDDEWAWRFRTLMRRPGAELEEVELMAFYGAVARAVHHLTDDHTLVEPPPMGPVDSLTHPIAFTTRFCRGAPAFLFMVYALIRHTRPQRTWANHIELMMHAPLVGTA